MNSFSVGGLIVHLRPRPPIRPAIALIALLFPLLLAAHKPNQSYVYFRIMEDSIHGSIQMTSDDINKALDLGLDRKMTHEDYQAYVDRVEEYLLKHIYVRSRYGEHPVRFTGKIQRLGVTGATVFGHDFVLENMEQVPDKLDLIFNPIYESDPTHRTFALIQYNWKAGIHENESMISLRFAPGDDGPKVLDLSDVSLWKGFRAMVVSGMYHIYIGLDHILFLLALLLPAVVYRREGGAATVGATGTIPLRQERAWRGSGWRPVEKIRPAFLYILKIVTFFTIAHTITLSLAALGIVQLPGYLVESLIALSIALAALHNIRPLLKNDGVIIAFVFGLFHGFGFASVLGEVGLRGEYMALSLLGFNLGVELAQILIICLAFPVLALLRKTALYRYILLGGSVLLIIIAMYWFIERLFDIDIPVYFIVEWFLNLF
jgi:hypothetical protein